MKVALVCSSSCPPAHSASVVARTNSSSKPRRMCSSISSAACAVKADWGRSIAQMIPFLPHPNQAQFPRYSTQFSSPTREEEASAFIRRFSYSTLVRTVHAGHCPTHSRVSGLIRDRALPDSGGGSGRGKAQRHHSLRRPGQRLRQARAANRCANLFVRHTRARICLWMQLMAHHLGGAG